jgi:hypothetical protein
MLLHHVKFTVHGKIAKRNEMKNVNYVKCIFKVGVRCSFEIQRKLKIQNKNIVFLSYIHTLIHITANL